MYVDMVEFCFGMGLFINAMLFVPQFIRILKTKHARDASFITFVGFNVINILTTLHGVIEHDLLLTLGSALSCITNGCVTLSILWYRYGPGARQ